MKNLALIFLLVFFTCLGSGASDWFAEETAYDPAVTTPAAFLGYEIGERHLTHAELVAYVRGLADESARVELIAYGRTHGHRPLMQLVITAPENLKRLEAIRQRHLSLAEPGTSSKLDLEELPVVVNLNYSIHGNEPSGANCAPLVAYHLAAATGPEMETFLKNTVILLDPCLNPDGLDRFANWANNNVGKNPNPDPQTREHREDWPGGRTNYYFFDLNRDWMLLTQPESQGRLEQYHQWLPNLVLDFHEMGTNSTYFFQPGVPERTHPLIPAEVYALTERVSGYFAEALDEAGSLYFTKERFDDFYPGKASTISDLKGAVGILFEQASSRGHIQESDNGLLDFPATIRNQWTLSLAVLEAARELRVELLENTRAFYRGSLREAGEAGFAGYRFASPEDPERARLFAEILRTHRIRVEPTAVGNSWYVPLRQPQYRYLQALVEKRTVFEQNLFYDITAWSLPLAFNLEWERLEKAPDAKRHEKPLHSLRESHLGYLVDWTDLNAPRLLLDLMEEDVMVKVAREPFTYADTSFGYGTLFVPVSIQAGRSGEIHAILREGAKEHSVKVVPVDSFLTPEGIDLGSNRFAVLEKPRILLAAGDGVDAYEAGTVWHLVDVLHDYPVTLVRPEQLKGLDLRDYTALVLPGARPGTYEDSLVEPLRQWTQNGGSVICLGSAAKWAIGKELVALSIVEKAGPSEDMPSDDDAEAQAPVERRPFAGAEDDRALERIRGAIFNTQVDISHPLAYGFAGKSLPVFVEGETFLQPSQNPYQTPLVFAADPLLAGYASEKNLARMAGSAAAVVESRGSGAVILFAHSPTFRAYWRGTEKLLLNAILYAPLMQAEAPGHY